MTEAVRNWPIPRNVKQVRQFLGFAGYYRRFVRGFASIARPLNNLLAGHPTKAKAKSSKSAKPAKFVWAEEQQHAFDDLKDRITHPPVLAYADFSRPFKIHTDASKRGLRAALYQVDDDGEDRVIAYASRSLNAAEKNYPAHKLEFLALKCSVYNKFHDNLYGGKFQVMTDNNPLTYVNTTATGGYRSTLGCRVGGVRFYYKVPPRIDQQ